MAIVRALKTGLWSDVTTWSTGALPTASDDVYSNTFTVTIDISPTVLLISNASASGVTAGGQFIPTNGITLTCTATPGITGVSQSGPVTFDSALTSGQSCSINVNITSGGSNGLIRNTGAGTVNITGNITGSSSGASTHHVQNTSTGTINVTGIVTGGSSANHAIYNGSSGTINITGTVTGGGPTVQYGWPFAIANPLNGTINVTGNVNGGSSAPGIGSGGSGVVSIVGTLTASNGVPAVASMTREGAIGTTASFLLTGPFITSANGTNPIFVVNWKWASTAPATYYQVRTVNTLLIRPLYTADSVGGNPATTNVRSGTIYGPNNELTGTCAVPPAGSVALGVPVDATTGTAAITEASIRSAVGLSSANLDTQISGINSNVSSRLASSSYTAPLDAAGTRSAIGLATANLDTQLSGIDSNVSTRLATTSYTAPLDAAGTRSAIGLASANLDTQFDTIPTASENASAVRTELATELSRIDTDISTRSTFDPTTDVVAHVTLVDTTTDLTNPPVVPTPEEIALAVATELDPTLTGIDDNVLTRLATADYTAPPTAEQNAIAVETQLATPLGNMDIAVSTRSTFDPITDVVAHVTLVDTTTDLTNPPVVPTPEQIALAVATELDPTLTEIDNNVLSRLAEADYTEPPSPEQNALAVREELTPELDRIANCATVDTTGQQIQNALTN